MINNNQTMKILITGSAGFVGKNLFNYLKKEHEVYGISRRAGETTTHQCDITKRDDLMQVLNLINPDLIVHSAALTFVDYCQEHKDETWTTNVDGTLNLVKWSFLNKKKIIYISTDYVYAGEKGNYSEESETKPVNIYGETKLAAEKIISILPNFLILRPTVIFGYDPGGSNFFMQLLRLKEKKELKKIVDDQISNPIDVLVLCEYIKLSIEKNISGVFNATGPETVDRFVFANLIASIFNIDNNLLQKVKTSELGQKALRPMNNGSTSTKLRSVLNYKCPSLRESLENHKKIMESDKIKNLN
ncbi:SDR family oxidoreductase [Candidatus Pacearchaeota archaeon]|nr:SDR family oxidoreductase [Candidatus Pacearchaeota archaeon]